MTFRRELYYSVLASRLRIGWWERVDLGLACLVKFVNFIRNHGFLSYPFQELTSICSPIISKPKPKVEPPKEEQKNAEQNGPVDGQGDNPGPQAAEQGTDTAVPSESDKKLPEMDID